MAVKFSTQDPSTPIKLQSEYIEPRLVDYEGDLSKNWFVIYYIWHTDKNSKVRKRIAIPDDTLKARRANAKAIIEETTGYLKAGYTVGKKSLLRKLVK